MPSTPLDTTLPDPTEGADPLLLNESSPLPALAQPDPTTVPTPEEEANVFTDVLAAPIRGVEGAVRSVYKLADFVTGDALPNWDHNFSGESKTTAGSIVENTSQFLAGFIPVFGQLGKVGALSGVARGMAAGAITDFAVFDGTQDRLSNLIQKVPALQNPISEFLANDEHDSAMEGRFKNTVEGLGLGALADGLAAGLKGIINARNIKAAGGSAEEANKALVAGFGDKATLEETLVAQRRRASAEAAPTPPALVTAEPAIKPGLGKLATDLFDGLSPTDSIKHIDSPDDIKALVGSLRDKELAQLGTRPTRSIEEEFKTASQVLVGYTGRDEQAVFSLFKASASSIEGATANALALGKLLPVLAEDAQKFAKLVSSGVATDENILKSLQAQERLAAALNTFEAFGTAQGRALNARKFIKSAELQSKDIARQLVEQFGGTGQLSAQLEKIAAASSGEGVGKLVSNQVSLGGRIFRAHNEYWMNAILSGPKTTVVNTLGNTFTTLYLPFEGMVGSLFRGDAAAAKAFSQQYIHIAETAQESMKWAFQSFRQGDGILNAGAKFASESLGSAKIDAGYLTGNANLASTGIKSEASKLLNADSPAAAHLVNIMGEVTRMPQRFLSGTDEFFKQINYRSAAKTKLYYEGLQAGKEGLDLASHVNNGMDRVIVEGGQKYSEAAIYRQAIAEAEKQGLDPAAMETFVNSYVKENFKPETSALAQYAFDVANDATFQRDLTGIPKKLQEAVQAHPLLQLVVPFVKTPTNILNFVGQRTFAFTSSVKVAGLELNALRGLHTRAVAEMTSPDKLVQAAAMGRATVGMAIFSGAGMLAMQGRITGKGPRDDAENRALMATGWQPYSFKIGDTYISYKRLDPIATFFGLVADWSEQSARQDSHQTEPLQAVMNSAAISLAANITNKSYLTGIQQITDALSNPERFAPRLLKNRLGSYIPNIVAQMRGNLDGDNALKEVRTYSDALFSRIPGLAGSLEPKRNLLGQSVDSALATTPLSAVNPFMLSPNKNDPVFTELAKLQHGFTSPSPAYQGVLNLLDIHSEKGQSAYDRWLQLHGEVKVSGKDLRSSLERLFKSSYYNKLADQTTADQFRSPRVAEVERLVGMYRRAAFIQTQREYPELKQGIRAVRQDQLNLRRGQAAQQLEALIKS